MAPYQMFPSSCCQAGCSPSIALSIFVHVNATYLAVRPQFLHLLLDSLLVKFVIMPRKWTERDRLRAEEAIKDIPIQAALLKPSITPEAVAVLLTKPLTTSNVVATFDTFCLLDLKLIAQHADNAEYNPKRFTACVMRIKEPKATALIFASGKVVVTGARSPDECKLAGRKFARKLSKMGFNAKFSDFKIQNCVGNCDVGFTIRLEGLVAHHLGFASYEPEVFPAVSLSMRS